eukprot:TRINITY_DN6_c0_g1_i3.p2 TRINITY_DN6_c0_g1~~TRINITY_DN6_c0_g1_i3.p2  ORF type:complete len:188 (-),score=49.01 TRINITY_DN6_c0_g1_i3:476-1039(-)
MTCLSCILLALPCTCRHMVGVCRELGVPCLATEQNPRVLLPSVPELQLGAVDSHPAVPIFAKQKFSMWTDEVQAHMAQLNTGSQQHRDTVILCGIEAHVCVLQTCLDLMQNGYSVHVVVDGVSSQRPLDRAVALRRMQQVGAFLTTAESVTFQVMETADNPSFRKVSALVKEHAKSPDQAFANMASL